MRFGQLSFIFTSFIPSDIQSFNMSHVQSETTSLYVEYYHVIDVIWTRRC